MGDVYSFLGFTIPVYMRDGVHNYVHRGIPPGDFLSAVIKNNLKRAVWYADDNNIRNLPAYVNYFYNYAPSACWGSEEKFNAWIEKHRNMEVEHE